MLRERIDPSEAQVWFTNVCFFSASATAPDWRLDGQPKPQHPRERVQSAFEACGLSFVNLTCLDDQLAESLVAELRLRGLNLTNMEEQTRVALISEWDTVYGRSLPQAFSLAATNGLRDASAVAAVSKRIHKFSYLRGLDGQFALREQAKGKPSQTVDESSAGNRSVNMREMERPEGTSQLDHARRLVERIRELETESPSFSANSVWGRRRFRAIGVLGSDVYDKLLLLQALREYFPEAIFFTTDLDARMFHPSQLAWSRNLIVASSYGLKLPEPIQGEIPPFRDTYQTASFLATRVALDDPVLRVRPPMEPHLFELGQTFPFELMVRRGKSDALSQSNARDPFRGSLAWFQLGICLIAAGFLGLIVHTAIVAPPALPPSSSENRAKELCLIGLSGLMAWLCLWVLAAANSSHSSGEPVAFTEGISIWPTELLRLAVLWLSVAFLTQAWIIGTREKQRLGELLHQGFDCSQSDSADAGGHVGWADADVAKAKRKPDADEPVARVSLAALFRRLFMANSISGWRFRAICQAQSTLHPHPLCGEQLLREYLHLRRFRARMGRILPWLVIYLAVICVLMAVLGPPVVPYRGRDSLRADRVVLCASVLGMTVAIFYLMDATRLCARLIWLVGLPTDWKGTITAHFQRQRNLDTSPAGPVLEDWIDIWVVRECSRNLGKLMPVPFLILGIMVLSRATFFDRWRWPWPLLVAVGLSFVVTFVSALRLRRAAEAVRKNALQNLNQKLSSVISQGNAGQALKGQIELMIREISATTEGAFAPVAEQPVFRAILMPFTGAGLLALLDYLASQ